MRCLRRRDGIAHALSRVVPLYAAKHLPPRWREVSGESVIVGHGNSVLTVSTYSAYTIDARCKDVRPSHLRSRWCAVSGPSSSWPRALPSPIGVTAWLGHEVP
jgi:hypothetical protein